MALDASGDNAFLYWGDSTRNVIERCQLPRGVSGNCTSINTVLADVGVVSGLAVDPVSKYIYWADGESLRVRRALLDFTTGAARLETLSDLVSLLYIPAGLALERGNDANPQAQALYYVDQHKPVRVGRLSLNGSGIDEWLVETGLSRPRAIALAFDAGQWFLVDSGTSQLLMAPFGLGGLQEQLYNPTLEVRGVAVRSDLEIRATAVLETSDAALPRGRRRATSLWTGGPSCDVSLALALCSVLLVSVRGSL